jgi:hypothetical protein
VRVRSTRLALLLASPLAGLVIALLTVAPAGQWRPTGIRFGIHRWPVPGIRRRPGARTSLRFTEPGGASVQGIGDGWPRRHGPGQPRRMTGNETPPDVRENLLFHS